MEAVIDAAVVATTVLLVAVTLLPLSGSHAWWVRMWDFPRVQIAVGLALAAGLALVLPGPLRWGVVAAAVGCLGYQLWRILPFTPMVRKEVEFAPGQASGDVTLLAANVLMENEKHDRVRAMVERVDPDVLLLMETDARWLEAMEPILARYPTILRAPRDDCYGMAFATRLEAASARFARLTEEETPSLLAELRTRDGAAFHFVGLHPQPPVPGVDTEERDAQILFAARFARKDDMPLVVMGDFNDAAWSDTARRFKRYGRYVDPRVGRGIYASFDANHFLIRCAIDQLYVTDDVAVAEFGLGPHVGSDHFPVIARIRVDRELAARLNRPTPRIDPDEEVGLDDRVERYRRRLTAVGAG
ncbi:MAG TPA: endonuclease/exonuclease/phosphatase family protein [Amaricoccus sp.]|nr:endonuclease/exonuclease/phosphatase family protein [Amaricoccus sp.]